MVPTQTYIVTGGNSGLGFECASALAKDSSTLVIIACRNALQGEQAAQRVRAAGGNVDVLPLDLARQASVRSFVETFRKRRFPPLVGVVCNAGMQNVGAPTQTEEGYETTFAVNHLGHYLLTCLLLSDLARGARIIFVSHFADVSCLRNRRRGLWRDTGERRRRPNRVPRIFLRCLLRHL
jgi:NAD(P)-dependent dehydrogenase (short-subunit alcohol dehydrogenase family)